MANNYLVNFNLTPQEIKIVNRQNAKNSNSFWLSLLKFLGVTFVSIALGSLTGGIATAIGESLELSMFATETSSFIANAVTQFTVDTAYDAITGNLSGTNTLLNLVFSFSEIGKIGRGLRADKILKYAKSLNFLKKLGINQEIKTYAELRNLLRFRSVLTRKRFIIRFGDKVTNEEIISAFAMLADSYTMKQLKVLPKKDLAQLLNLHKIYRKMMPTLNKKLSKSELSQINEFLLENSLSIKEVANLNDIEFVAMLNKLKGKISIPNIKKLDLLRRQSSHFNKMVDAYLKLGRITNSVLQKLDPTYWVKKIIDKMMEPIEKSIAKLRKKIMMKVDITKYKNSVLKNSNWINGNMEMFLGYRVHPLSFDEVILQIRKMPHVWKTKPKVTKYNDIFINTTLVKATEFLTNEHQNNFYRTHWQLGRNGGYSKILTSVGIFMGTSIVRTSLSLMRDYNRIRNLINGTTSLATNVLNFDFKDEAKHQFSILLSKTLFGSIVASSYFQNLMDDTLTTGNFLNLIKSKSQSRMRKRVRTW